MTYNGIDYGLGQTNIDHETGIRYGVIHAGEIAWWNEQSEPEYSDTYYCPKCGNEMYNLEKDGDVENLKDIIRKEMPEAEISEMTAIDIADYLLDTIGYGRDEYASDYSLVCPSCEYITGADGLDFQETEPIGFTYDSEGYQAFQSYDDPDIFVTKSPYYTLAQFCSPCAPGAGYLMDRGTVKAYCFGHDWFEGGTAPYPVYDVKTGKRVKS